MEIKTHGGACCGITQIHGFPVTASADVLNLTVDAALLRQVPNSEGCGNQSCCPSTYEDEDEQRQAAKDHNHAIECVLTDQQLEKGWDATLAARGFKKVARFFNNNSSNYCNVFYLFNGDHEAHVGVREAAQHEVAA